MRNVACLCRKGGACVDLSVERITCRYGARTVLEGFSLEVAPGEFLAVAGPNGSGKSTLVRAIAGTLPLAGGRIRLGQRDLARTPARERARLLAVVAQETAVEFDFAAEEIVMMGRLPHLRRFQGERQQDRTAVRESMERTDTWQLCDRLITGLSGGERQRVLVARALAQEPRLLLLDEPTAHLDIAHQVELLDLVRRLNREQGVTVITVLHDLNLAALYASRLLMIKEGRMVAEGSPRTVVTEANVAAVFGSRVRVLSHPVEGTPQVMLLSGD